MTLVVPKTWLAEAANEGTILEIVDIVESSWYSALSLEIRNKRNRPSCDTVRLEDSTKRFGKG